MNNQPSDIERYRSGELTPAEMHALEKRALTDPFLAEALEGAQLLDGEELSADILELSRRLEEKKRRVWLAPLRIAAGLVILIGASYLVYISVPSNSDQPIAEVKKEKSPEVPGLSSTKDSSLTATESGKASQLLSLAKPDEKPKTAGEQLGPAAAKPGEKQNEENQPLLDQASQAQGLAAIRSEELSKEKEADLAVAEVAIAKEEVAKEPETKKVENAPVVIDLIKDASRDDKLVDRRSVSRKKEVAAVDVEHKSGGRVITGQVTLAEDGKPLPGVNIVLKGTTIGAVTDLRGNYSISFTSLPFLPENPQLAFSFIGLQTTEVAVGLEEKIDVKLQEDVSQLSEVVVTGAGGASGLGNDALAREPVIKMASPVGGLKAYNKYLEDSLRYPAQALDNKIKGKVTVQFTIKTDGSLSEFNVVRSLGYGCDDEVVRLVKEGPKWNPTTEDDVPIESEVKVKMKFDPDKLRQ